MEIIHVILGKANPERMNGVNKVVHQLATRQTAAGRKVQVWGITRNPVHDYPERNFETQLFHAYQNKFQVDRQLLNEMELHRNSNTIFHLHGGFNPAMYSVARNLHRLSIPFVFTPHGAYNTIAMQRSRVTKWVYIQLYEKKLVRWASCIHCLGKSEVTGLHKIYPNARTRLVPYGYEAMHDNIFMYNEQEPVIGFCGRLDIYTKGLDVLLDAFSRVKKAVPDAALWIIGDGPERPKLEKMVAEKKLDGVTLWGSKYGAEKDALLQQVHIFAHPSRNEGLPASVLEAAAMGIPCVVTEATNVGDSINQYQCGSVIEHPDAGELFNAIMHVQNRVKQEGRKPLRDAAKQMVRESYNWNHIIGRFDELYQAAC